MRVTRPTSDVQRIRRFYEIVVGLPVIWSFDDHAGYDGVIFETHDNHSQLELVCAPHRITPRPTAEDAMVLYIDDPMALTAVVARLRSDNTTEIDPENPELNPYWPQNGALTFVDPDGYRLVISPS